MKFKSEELISELKVITETCKAQAEKFKGLSLEELNQRKSKDSWSILECLEHLNLYGDFYLDEIEKKLERSKSASTHIFKSGWAGNYFAESMKPKEKLNKMKTFKDKNPIGSQLDSSVIDRFIDQQNKMLELLEKAKKVNLTKVRTKITLPILSFKIGDTFRFVIYHNQRHIEQAQRVL